jgi:hypothetical protein
MHTIDIDRAELKTEVQVEQVREALVVNKRQVTGILTLL